MPSNDWNRHPHGMTFQQAVLLMVVRERPGRTSSEIADIYKAATGQEIAYNFQHIVTARMCKRGFLSKRQKQVLIKKKRRNVSVWRITKKGREALSKAMELSQILAKEAS